MDRKLHALVTRDVLTDTVRIDIRGSLNEESRPTLVHLMTRVRSMGISSHILVDLSNAALIESVALAGLRSDLNAMDEASAQEKAAGVSLWLSGMPDAASPVAGIAWESLVMTDELTGEPGLDTAPDLGVVPASGSALQPAPSATGPVNPASEISCGRPLSEYSDAELFAASDAVFALLDDPEASGGSVLLAQYNDIGEEISRRNLLSGLDGPADDVRLEPVDEGQVAS
jgi:anti-anti-sigma regulatory factor